MRELQLRDAKALFSAVVDQAAHGQGTVVTRHGRPAVVIIGYADWQRMQGTHPSFADLLLALPDVGEIPRDPAPTHDFGARDRGT